jgi:TonB family protein
MKLRLTVATLAVAVACSARSGLAEDVQLRAQAIALMSRARILSSLKGGPYNIRTEVTFRTVGENGMTGSGSLNRLRGNKGYLRQDVVWGEYRASMVGVNMQEARVGPWDVQPYAVRRLFMLVPFSVGEFDSKDVVREIKDGGASTCVIVETIEGETREPGEVCLSKATGAMVGAQAGGATYEYSGYHEIAGALMPGHIEYRERSGFSLSADIVMTKLDTLPDDAFAFPAGARVGTLCPTFSEPIPVSVPQPPVGGGDGSAVSVVDLQAEISAEGAVVNPYVVRSDRPELNAEAVRTVQAWRYEPGTCAGKPNQMRIDIQVRFQGR